MALIPVKIAQFPLEITTSGEIDLDNDRFPLGSAANAGQAVKVSPRVFVEALVSGIASPTTEDFTSADTLTSAESGKHCTNIGAVIPVTLTAPASPTLGDRYTLERVANYAFRFKPGSGHTVNGGTADKYVEITATGSLTFEYKRTGAWVITNDAALWNFEP